ncbi:phosphatidylinositol-specific phospholipase C1-like protein [Granulicella sp. WH15]|uniref:phosphatidylinositol-specific phospholipase C1-like protein n=1 Tax=Granulicella sp. WH15 TaxID=2602070 RepID=UPI002107827B|nr:phosphatidylinositol-specific phospholipase C1-like protein [Granulicella sp. WH15]
MMFCRSLSTACALLALAPLAGFAQSQAKQDKLVHLNQIQVIGTHNSYNTGFAPSEAKFFSAQYPKAYHGLEYHHQTLAEQLSGGVRQLELDIVQDPKGGRFAHPKIVGITKEQGLPADPDFDPQHEMERPGFKVVHLGDLNERSSCQSFVHCLQDIRGWSKAHPDHMPIFVLVEDKQGRISQLPGAVEAEPWTAETWDALDREIHSVFPEKEIITPDMVRGRYATLEEAVLAGQWPTLAKSRGKVVFLLYIKKSAPAYMNGHPSLRGRVLFTNSDPGQPEAAFVERDSGTPEIIDPFIKSGYLVRTRADFNTDAGRNNDTARRDSLLLSGAQMISTDFPLTEPAPWSGYTVGLPHGLPARCNPVNAPSGCKDELLEPHTKSGGEPSPSNHP